MTESKRKRKGLRADGRIQVTATIGINSEGKSIRKSFYGTTRAEAIAKRDAYLNLRKNGISEDAEKITVNEWIDQWAEKYLKKSLSQAHLSTTKVYVNKIRSQFGCRLLSSIREADLQQSLYRMDSESASSIKKYSSILRSIFSKAQANSLLLTDPSRNLDLPEGTSGTHRALEQWEYSLILDHWQDHYAGLWALLMLLTGMRRSEMVALNWSNVNLTSQTIDIVQKAELVSNKAVILDKMKSKSSLRSIPICGPLQSALLSIPEENRTGLVCLSSRKNPITPSAFKRGWASFNSAMSRIHNGQPVNQRGCRLHPDPADEVFSVQSHDLRHTFATALYDAGVSVKAAQYYLGHSDVKITMNLYTHLSQERERRERSTLTDFLNSWLIKK